MRQIAWCRLMVGRTLQSAQIGVDFSGATPAITGWHSAISSLASTGTSIATATVRGSFTDTFFVEGRTLLGLGIFSHMRIGHAPHHSLATTNELRQETWIDGVGESQEFTNSSPG